MTKEGLVASIAALKSKTMMMSGMGENPSCDPKFCWMKRNDIGLHPVTPEEAISLAALISYVAHMTSRSQFRIEREFSDRFCIPNVKFLPSDMYDAAIRYLVEQVPQTAAHA